MARKRRSPPSGDRPAPLADGRFAALRRVKVGKHAAVPTPTPAEPAPTGTGSDDDETLFRRMVADATPLADTNRAHIEGERPAPRPRPKPATDADPPPRHRAPSPADDDAWFRQAMQDVTPLPERNLAHDEARKPDPGSLTPPTEIDPDDVLARLAAGTVPLKDDNRADIAPPPPVAAPLQKEADARAVLDESLDAFTLEDRLDIGEEATFLRPGLPRRVLADLRRGRWIVQGEIDLHGMTRDEARAALGDFLASALVHGQRCVRVVHGKGLRSPGKVGVLKQLSRGWLAQREEILAFCQARAHEGGSGALRVLLRAADKRPRPTN